MISEALHDQYVSEIGRACAEGRGYDLLKSYVRDQAIGYAEAMFLAFETFLWESLAIRTKENEEALDAAIRTFPDTSLDDFLIGLRKGFAAFGMAAHDISQIEKIAEDAYVERFSFLIDADSSGGGAA